MRAITPGFLGLSVEYYALEDYTGSDPSAIDPVFLQLIRNLSPNQSPIIRIGGDSTDWSWIPTPGVTQPPGVSFTMNANYLQVLSALDQDLNARYLLGVNLEADNEKVAAYEANALVNAVGRSHIEALSIGNEPDLYTIAWYHTKAGVGVDGRKAPFTIDDYESEFNALAPSLPKGVGLAGPESGAMKWEGSLDHFAATAKHLSVVTVHRYPTEACNLTTGDPTYPTVADLLSPAAAEGEALGTVAQARSAHEHGEQVRVDEMNSTSCFGAAGVSNVFASALWAVADLFSMATIGVDGVNFHTTPSAQYRPFVTTDTTTGWQATVNPEYYGMMLFAEAAPAGSHLLKVTGTGTASQPDGVRAWATVTSAGVTHVVVLNTGSTRTFTVQTAASTAPANLLYLSAPSLQSTTGVSLGGLSFATPSTTGQLAGTPQWSEVDAQTGGYTISVPADSVAMLTYG